MIYVIAWLGWFVRELIDPFYLLLRWAVFFVAAFTWPFYKRHMTKVQLVVLDMCELHRQDIIHAVRWRDQFPQNFFQYETMILEKWHSKK